MYLPLLGLARLVTTNLLLLRVWVRTYWSLTIPNTVCCRWAPTGTLYGFTTNPLILDRDRVPCTIESCKQLALTVRDCLQRGGLIAK